MKIVVIIIQNYSPIKIQLIKSKEQQNCNIKLYQCNLKQDYTEAPPQNLIKKNSSLGMEEDVIQQQQTVFTGKGVRLDGKTGLAQPRKQSEDVKVVAEPYNPRKNKLINGIRQNEDVQLFTGTNTKVGAQKKQL